MLMQIARHPSINASRRGACQASQLRMQAVATAVVHKRRQWLGLRREADQQISAVTKLGAKRRTQQLRYLLAASRATARGPGSLAMPLWSSSASLWCPGGRLHAVTPASDVLKPLAPRSQGAGSGVSHKELLINRSICSNAFRAV